MVRKILGGLFFLLVVFSGEFVFADTDRPNVIVIMTDDQGYGDFGFVGNKTILTPNLDALASQSTQMTRFYVHPVCTPTRAALMTGRYPQRTGAYDTYIGRAMMSPEETTIAELLKDNGYSTGIFGKWHLGDCYPMRPSEQGFDESLIHLGGGLAQPSDPIENRRRYTNPILFHNNKKGQSDGYCTDIFFSESMNFIRKAKKQKKPFFAYIATNAPHGPFHDVPKESLDKYRGKTVNDKTDRIFAMIDNVDQNVGRLMKFLKEENLEQNTIVFFLTDNGPNTERFVGPFRGRKGQVQEGGIRTVLLAKWPNKFPKAKNSVPAANIDLFPTIADLTKTDLPKASKLDGRSLAPVLLGKTPQAWPTDRPMIFQWHRGEPVRGKSFAVVSGDWKLVSQGRNGKQRKLFNVTTDPAEKNDLLQENKKIARRLGQFYDRWYDSLNGGKPYQYIPKPIEIGTEKERLTSFTKQDWFRTAGKGWGSLGVWHFKSKHTKEYIASVVLSRPLRKSGMIDLKVGSKTIQTKAEAGSDRIDFPQFQVGKAEGTIQVSLPGAKPIPHFYQLHLIQQ